MTARRRLALAGIPSNSSGRRDGVARGPAALRTAGLMEALAALDPSIADLGDADLPEPSPGRDPASRIIDPVGLVAAIDAAAAATRSALEARRFAVLVGGDCPILLGALEATAASSRDGTVGCLFVDGHEDAYPPEASPTGEAADMELGLALGRGIERLPGALRDRLPLLDPDAVVVLGARDAAELGAHGVPSLRGRIPLIDDTALQLDPVGTAHAEAARVARAAGAWWLHVDLDVLSTGALAAVDYRQSGGLAWSELAGVVRGALAVSGCAGMTLTIYNPDLDPGASGAASVVAFLAEVLGSRS